jgi:hypothetical protein
VPQPPLPSHTVPGGELARQRMRQVY